jgi:TP901 family phage tail tape measure protein
MNNELKLALQLSFIDIASAGLDRMRRNIRALGDDARKVQRDFDIMERSITRGLKAVAVVNYSINRLRPGIAAAASLQEATLNVKMNLMESGQNAGDLAKQLATVRATAIDIQKQMPFGAKEVMGIENVLLKAGLNMKDVTAKGGAAWAAAALATISGESPQAMGEGLISMASPFNIKGGQFGELANFIQKIDQASVTTIPEIVEGMKYVAGTAANMKVSWQDTLTAMGAMSQQGLRGSMAGTSLNDFLIRMVGTSRIERKVLEGLNNELRTSGKAPLEFFQGGHLKSLPAIINNLRTSLGGLTDQKRMFVLQKIFGAEGARAAFALIHQGAGSWEEVAAGVGKAADAAAKLDTRMEGLTANIKSLMGTSTTTAAAVFDPWLRPLREMASLANDAVAALGLLAGRHPGATAGANAILGGALLGVGAYGLYSLGRGGLAGARVLKGLGGIKGILSNMGKTSLGIAEGKAVEAATGVTPVFVTNWPASMGGLGGESGSTVVAAGKRLPWIAGAGVAGAALAGIPFSFWMSEAARQNGWSSRTYGHNSREYEVMGIGGRGIKNDIKLDIQIDGSGRVFSRSNDLNTSINTVPRGGFFAPIASH